jgi:hypothetical protein
VAGVTNTSAPDAPANPSGATMSAAKPTRSVSDEIYEMHPEFRSLVGIRDFDWNSDLAAGIVNLEPQDQYALARWAAIRAFEFAGLAEQPWVAPALDSLREGLPLPPPFRDISTATERLISANLPAEGNGGPYPPAGFAADGRPSEAAEIFSGGPINRPFYALPAVFSATDPHPLVAAFQSLSHACSTYGGYADSLLSDARREFDL